MLESSELPLNGGAAPVQVATFDALVRTAEGSAELGERFGSLEQRRRGGEHIDRLAQEIEAVRAALDEAGGAERNAAR